MLVYTTPKRKKKQIDAINDSAIAKRMIKTLNEPSLDSTVVSVLGPDIRHQQPHCPVGQGEKASQQGQQPLQQARHQPLQPNQAPGGMKFSGHLQYDHKHGGHFPRVCHQGLYSDPLLRHQLGSRKAAALVFPHFSFGECNGRQFLCSKARSNKKVGSTAPIQTAGKEIITWLIM